MSADAKAWPEDERGYLWKGICDANPGVETPDGAGLSEVLLTLDFWNGRPLAWSIHVYPDGRTGLVGYTT